MPTSLDKIIGRRANEREIPVCPDHDVPMNLRGKVGRPARFEDQTQSSYTVIYACTVDGCANTASREVARSQVPVPGASPIRPLFSRRRDIR